MSTETEQTPETAPEGLVVDGVDLGDINLFEPPPETEETPAEPAAAAEVASAEPAPAEPKPEPAPETAKALARLERQLQQERQRAKELEEKANQKPKVTLETLWQVAAENGITPQQAVQFLAEGGTPPKVKTEAERRAEELEKQVSELRRETEERKAAEQRAVLAAKQREYKAGLLKEFEANEKTPHLAAFGEEAVDALFAEAERLFQTTGEPPDMDELAQKFEQRFAERYAKAAEALTKRRGAVNMPAASRSPQQTASGRPPASGPKSLTNRAAASASPPKREALTDEEREEEAAAALSWL